MGRFERAPQRLQDAIEVVKNLTIPKPHDAIPVTPEFGATPSICIHALGMVTAIQFDNQLACRAGETRNILPDRMLPPKFPRREALAQGSPGNPFDLRALAAQPPCDQRSCSQG